MSDPDLLRYETLRWLRYARDDLYTADTLAKIGDTPIRSTCYHCQQAVEKALKAVLVYEDMDMARTHDLSLLQALLPEGWKAKKMPIDLTNLTIWAGHQRYPGDYPEPSSEDAAQAIVMAHEVLESILEDFKARGVEVL